MINFKLPSMTRYANASFIGHSGIKSTKYISWLLGITERNPEYDELIVSLAANQHLSLVQDQSILNKYKSFMDPNRIPQQFKQGHSYYKDYENIKESIYPATKLEESSVLSRNANINTLVKKLFNRDMSPLLADKSLLVGLPKAYFIIFEWDELKDDGLLYAERLKEAGIDVKVAFYEKAFHGMATLVNNLIGYQLARNIESDLIEYLRLNL
jgi:acetyl esterase/lipase